MVDWEIGREIGGGRGGEVSLSLIWQFGMKPKMYLGLATRNQEKAIPWG
jgi:hypothetical protein